MTRRTTRPFDDLLAVRRGGADLTLGRGRSEVARAATADEWTPKRDALLALFRMTLGEQPALDCPLALSEDGTRDRGDHLERRVSYAVEPDERVTSVVLVPKGPARARPGVLCVHPTCSGAKETCVGLGPAGEADWAYGLELVRRGFVVLAPDLLGAGDRTYPGRAPFDNAPLYAKHPRWSGTGKDVWDMRRALDVLCATPEVDARRVAAVGHSQGGSVSVYTAVLDERVRAVATNCGLWPWRLSRNPFNLARTSWWIGMPRLRPFAWSGKDAPVDVHELFALLAPRPLLAITALNDCQYTAADAPAIRLAWLDLGRQVARAYALRGGAGAFRQRLHVGGHAFRARERNATYAFLRRALAETAGGQNEEEEKTT
jgi:dienelactone hydrolase